VENKGIAMHCFKATRLLQLYLDKQLSLEQMRPLEAHLFSCPACRQELRLLEEIESALTDEEPVYEPADFTSNVMWRIAQSEQEKRVALLTQPKSVAFRLSLREFLSAILLATFATCGIILGQPSLRATLPIANGHDELSLAWIAIWHSLPGMNSNTLLLCFWIVGTLLGVWITLVLAGAEMRSQWFRAMIERLPVW
jgi:predicted anti-sigma-YlaC factor YlaD